MPDERSAARAAQPSRRRVLLLSLAVLAVVVVGAAAWLGSRVMTVRSELGSAQEALSAGRSGEATTANLSKLGQHSASAAAASEDPLWRAAELIPGVGDNLRAVRVSSAALDELANGLAVPLLNSAAARPAGGVLPSMIAPLQASAPRLAELDQELTPLAGSSSLLAQVRDAVDQLAPVLHTASELARLGPGMLGSDAPRNYLIVGQSNAESVALGGSAASVTLVRVEDGSVRIVRQTDSSQYRNNLRIHYTLPADTLSLYGTTMRDSINATPSRPDFPTMAKLVVKFWDRDIGADEIDGVVSIDPIGLSNLLEAVGPVMLKSGEKVTADNVIRLTLKDVYERYQEGTDFGNGYLKQVAGAIFTQIAGGDYDGTKVLGAAQKAIHGNSLMFWSADADVQRYVKTTRLGGVLPKSNSQRTTLGVFFRDNSMGSKIDYYMDSAATVTTACGTDGETVYSVQAKLRLNLTDAAQAKLPEYVNSNLPDKSEYRTQVYIYGPPGSVVSGVQTGKRTKVFAKPGLEDLGRPVASFYAYTQPGETGTVTATFSLPKGEGTLGPLAVRTTPMVRPTQVSLIDKTCPS